MLALKNQKTRKSTVFFLFILHVDRSQWGLGTFVWSSPDPDPSRISRKVQQDGQKKRRHHGCNQFRKNNCQ